jgi:hypothetical protein
MTEHLSERTSRDQDKERLPRRYQAWIVEQTRAWVVRHHDGLRRRAVSSEAGDERGCQESAPKASRPGSADRAL